MSGRSYGVFSGLGGRMGGTSDRCGPTLGANASAHANQELPDTLQSLSALTYFEI